MALPKQAQRQVEEANRIIDQISGDTPKMEVVDVPPVEPKESAKELPEGPSVPAPAAVSVEASEPVVEPAEEPPAAVEPDVDWKKKYDVLQGKYNAEVPQLHQDVKDLKELVASLNAPAPAVTTPEPEVRVTADDVDAFGQDFFDAVGRRAREIYDPVVNDLKGQVAELKSQLGGVSETVVQSSRDKVFAKLDAAVEDWREMNQQQEFLDWLGEPDPYSGDPRGKMLDAAFQANDAERVAAFFTGFKKEHAAVAPQPTTDSEPVRTPAVDLNDHVAPGKAPTTSSSPASAQAQKHIWTRSDIVDFYRDCQLGKFKNDAPRREQIERDIFAAQREGRIKDK